MIIFLKKYNLLLCLGIVFFCIMCIFNLNDERIKEVSVVPGFNKTVVIDAGHGYPDGGAEALDGTLEKDLNLKIATFVQEFMEQGGVDVIVTRADDEGIFEKNADNIKQKKRSDIKNREKLMNGSNADIFISIHLNKFPEEKYSGPQVFHAKGEKSKSLAEFLQKRLNDDLMPEKNREIKQAGSEIYLLKKAEIPAVLVECGFMSNEKELALLKQEEYQKRVAWAIYCGICDYFAKENT